MNRSILLAITLVFLGCPDHRESDPADDDTSIQDDDDTIGSDDDDDTTEPSDICDEHPGAILCDGDTEIVCDELGDIASMRDCDTEAGEYCVPDHGCVECDPGQRRCDHLVVQECDPDGQGWSDVEDCGAVAGQDCIDGECVSLCQDAEDHGRNDGCAFLAVDMEITVPYGGFAFGIVAGNPHESLAAEVVVELRDQDVWTALETRSLDPQTVEVFELEDGELTRSALSGNAFRITSSIPVYAWSFNPVLPRAVTDASLLVPVAATDTSHRLPGWGQGVGDSSWATMNIVAGNDGTEVSVVPSSATAAGDGIPSSEPGDTLTFTLDQGDHLQLVPAELHESFAGTVVSSTPDPVSVFSGHGCAYVPVDSSGACNHLEEQALGLARWGTEYVAARLPHRNPNFPEEAHWQAVAGDTPISLIFDADPAVTGLPALHHLEMEAGEVVDLQVTGDLQHPGDFVVTGDGTFMLTQYSVGWGSLDGSLPNGVGDPCMAQTIPIDGFRDEYMTFAPEGWDEHTLVLVRSPDLDVRIDGVDVSAWPHESFAAPQKYEVLHVAVDPGAHLLDGDAPFGLLVMGWGSADAYCYPGGFEAP